MSTNTRSITILMIALTLAAGALAGHAQEPASEDSAAPVTVSPLPGPHRARLAELAGEFDLTTTFWLEPGAEPEVSRLPARRELALGGRVLRLEVGPDAGGFRGIGILGYDNARERYWYVWTDTSTTGPSILYGSLASDGSGVFEGETPTPFGTSPMRAEIRREGNREVHDYLFPDGNGGSVKFLELVYERRSGASSASPR